MNWKIGDIAQGKHSGYIYKIITIEDNDFGAGKVLKAFDHDDILGAIIPLALVNLIPVEPRKGRSHPLTTIFK